MLHADGQLFAAHRADAVPRLGLHRGEADAAVPVSIQVVFTLLREKFHRAAESIPGADGPDQLRIGQSRIQQVRLPAQLAGGVGVGVGDQSEPVQGGEPPVHGRVGGESGLHGVDLAGKAAKAFLHGVKAGECAEQGEVGRPDVGGNQLRVRTGLQGQLQQVPAVQTQDGTAIRADIPHRLQPGRHLVRRLQAGEEYQMVDFPGLAVPLVNAADLPGDEKPGGFPGSRQPQLFPQGIQPIFRGGQLLPHFRPPGGMGKVAGTGDGNAFFTRPPVQMGQVAVPAGGAGVTGVNVQVGYVHGAYAPLSKIGIVYGIFRPVARGAISFWTNLPPGRYNRRESACRGKAASHNRRNRK